jgi:hypothetical protein
MVMLAQSERITFESASITSEPSGSTVTVLPLPAALETINSRLLPVASEGRSWLPTHHIALAQFSFVIDVRI